MPQLKHLLIDCLRNPRYVIYLWKNIHIIRDHFPSLWQYCLRKKALDLGEEAPLNRLHVILRTTDLVMNLNSTRQLDDMGIADKQDVIRIGGCSLFGAAKRFVEEFGDKLKITIVSDRLSAEGLCLYREAARKVSLDFDVVESVGHGNAPSFQTQLDIAFADKDDTLVLILEDDYLLLEDALVVPFKIMRDHSSVVGFNPHFHPDRVQRQDVGRLCVVDHRLYCQVASTCCTFFMRKRDLKRYERYLRFYKGTEDGSVNIAWERELCLAPLGWTLAEHLHRNDLSPTTFLGTTPHA